MILEYAPRAAQEASHLGAHQEAAQHYRTALDYGHRLAAGELARLLDGLSYEFYLTGKMDQAIRLRADAIQHWRKSERLERIGEGLRWLSRLYWFQGNKQEADRYAAEAIDLLEKLPAGQELAMAYSIRLKMRMI